MFTTTKRIKYEKNIYFDPINDSKRNSEIAADDSKSADVIHGVTVINDSLLHHRPQKLKKHKKYFRLWPI